MLAASARDVASSSFYLQGIFSPLRLLAALANGASRMLALQLVKPPIVTFSATIGGFFNSCQFELFLNFFNHFAHFVTRHHRDSCTHHRNRRRFWNRLRLTGIGRIRRRSWSIRVNRSHRSVRSLCHTTNISTR